MKKYLITLAVIFGIGFVYYVEKPEKRVSKEQLKEALESDTASLDSTETLQSVMGKMVNSKTPIATARSGIVNSQKRIYSKTEISDSDLYFKKLIKEPEINLLYNRSKQILGSSTEGEGAARWITLGVRFESTPDYGNTLNMAIQDANLSPDAVLGKLHQSIDTIRNDPFIYQMSMNLVYQLNLDSSKLAQFYGEELEHQLKEATANPSDSFWVATLGLTFASQAGVKDSEITPYIKRGLASSKAPENVINDFKKSAQFYFPDSGL